LTSAGFPTRSMMLGEEAISLVGTSLASAILSGGVVCRADSRAFATSTVVKMFEGRRVGELNNVGPSAALTTLTCEYPLATFLDWYRTLSLSVASKRCWLLQSTVH
jgi:hypothetical protein